MLTDKDGKPLGRSEAEGIMKNRSSVTVSIFAAMLAICALISNGNSSRILNNTIAINDLWGFYQAKSIKQTIAEQSRNQIADNLAINGASMSVQIRERMQGQIAEFDADIARYESDPRTNEGKRELMAQARRLESERTVAKQRSPWYGMASATLQIAIVLSGTCVLGLSMMLLAGSIMFGTIGAALLANGYFVLFQWPL